MSTQLFLCFKGVASSEVCISRDPTQPLAPTLLIYCDNGCCGDPGGQYCCTDKYVTCVEELYLTTSLQSKLETRGFK